MIIAMMMAMDRNRLIGSDGGMPWHISTELQYFKRVTMGKPIIMGRVTHTSIGRGLPGRLNIVVSRSVSDLPQVSTVSSLPEAFEQARQSGAAEAVVIGGASLCQSAMDFTEKLYLTVIDHAFEGGDTWLDSYVESEWTETDRTTHDETGEGGYRYSCLVLERELPATVVV